MSHHASTSNNNDKAEPLTKEEWQTRLESFEFKQADMNKLIMNYLVTGEYEFPHESIELANIWPENVLKLLVV